MTTHLTDEERKSTQGNLQAYLKEMQTRSVPRTPRIDTTGFSDQPTLLMSALPRPTTLPPSRPKTDFEGWLDAHIFAYWEKEHRFPRVIHINSIRKLEFIVEQLERHESPVRWHEYIFKHTNGWISLRLETRIMGYSEVECE